MTTRQASQDHVRIEFLKLPENSGQWYLVMDFLRLRTRVFVNQMNWDLLVDDEIEFEQYDTATVATYIIAHRDGLVIGGARLIRCDSTIGDPLSGYSYMIRDAYLGRISLPQEICDADPPTDAETWELTRLISISNDRSTARLILDAANDYIRSHNGTKCLFLGPPAFMRMAKAYGYDPQPMGKVSGNESGRFLAFACPVK